MKKNASVTQIAIVDAHSIVREGIKHVCAQTKDIKVSLDTASASAAIGHSKISSCDVLLLDIAQPDRNGIEMLKKIKRELPNIEVLIFSMCREDQYASRCLKAGAAGFLNKDASVNELIGAIRQVAAGAKYISPALAQELANQIGRDPDVPLHESLSNREYQVMIMIASGKSVSDIARELSLSVKTVSMFRARALNKLEMRHNAEMTHYAVANRLVEVNPA